MFSGNFSANPFDLTVFHIYLQGIGGSQYADKNCYKFGSCPDYIPQNDFYPPVIKDEI